MVSSLGGRHLAAAGVPTFKSLSPKTWTSSNKGSPYVLESLGAVLSYLIGCELVSDQFGFWGISLGSCGLMFIFGPWFVVGFELGEGPLHTQEAAARAIATQCSGCVRGEHLGPVLSGL